MKLPQDLTALDEALGRYDDCAACTWREIDRLVASGAADVNEQLAALYRRLDESAADVGRALHGVLQGQYSIKQCLPICIASRNGLNARSGLISSVIRTLVDDWRHRDRRFEPRQPCNAPADSSPPRYTELAARAASSV